MDELELHYCNNRLMDIMNQDIIDDALRSVGWDVGVQINATYCPDSALTQPDNFPQGVIVHAHAMTTKKNAGVAITRRLSEQRPDLSIILGIDPGYSPRKFGDHVDYEYVRQLVEEGFDATQPVTVEMAGWCDFFHNGTRMREDTGSPYTFINYVRQLRGQDG